jgi:hypothetical protein
MRRACVNYPRNERAIYVDRPDGRPERLPDVASLQAGCTETAVAQLIDRGDYMLEPLRTIRFGQTHRRTGLRRRFIIAQVDHGPTKPVDGMCTWHYKVRIGENGVWSAFRPFDVLANATDDEVRAAAKDHLAGRIGGTASERPPTS